MDVKTAEILLAYDRFIQKTLLEESSLQSKIKFAAMKFLRAFLPGLKSFYSQPEPTPCDVLFLMGYGARLDGLLRAVRAKGFTLYRQPLAAKAVLKQKMLCPPDTSLPRPLYYYDALAKFLVRKYQPKVVCGSLDFSPFASFLRRELQASGGKLINIAHGLTSSGYKCTMFDFDYYFLFGQSSFNYIETNPVRVGSTRAVLTGSPFVTPDFDLPPNMKKKVVLFFSQIKYERFAVRDALIDNTKIVIDWARAHPEFHLLVKNHPGGDAKSVQSLCQGVPNITVLPKTTSMVDAVKQASLTISTASNATLEAAVLGRPAVIVNKSDLWPNYLSLEDFFLPRATSVEELHQNIQQTFDQYNGFLQKAREFSVFHLTHTTGAVEFMADCIEAISRDEEPFTWIPIEENIEGLQAYL